VATWIAHLRIAERLVERIPGLDEEAFAVGSIAPDSGIPNEDWTEFDPPAGITHFHGLEGEKKEIEDLRFYREYLAEPVTGAGGQRLSSFLWGYFFHLITDRLWALKVGQPTHQRFARQFEEDPEFISEVKRDWYGLDFDHVRAHPSSLYWRVFRTATFIENPLPFLPQGAIQRNLGYIQKLYQREDEEIEDCYIRRPNKYLQKEDMDRFVTKASAILEQVHRAVTDGTLRTQHAMSIFELEFFARQVGV
jgi:hypothetical protein